MNAVEARDDRPLERDVRRELRRSYGCDCSGDVKRGARVDPDQTDGVLQVVSDWTGTACHGCPWRALDEPIVTQVFRLYRAYDKSALALYRPQPSHREMEGLVHLQTVLDRMEATALEEERSKRKSQG